MTEQVVRTDKLIECNDCYRQFWIDKGIPLRLTWCPNCNSKSVRLMRLDNKPLYKNRIYHRFVEE